MKRSILLSAIALSLIIGLSPADQAAQERQSAEVLLGAALHQEEVEGNLEAAIAAYRKFLGAYSDNRALAAQAQFHIGMCYEKLGRREAQKAYEEVLAKYTDQTEFAAKARERLAVLAGPGLKTLTSRKLENAPGDAGMSGTISPDGRYLTHWDEESEDLALRDFQTGKDRRLTNEAVGGAAGSAASQGAGGSAWSFDGNQIAYAWYISKADTVRAELRIIGPDGGKPRVLTQFAGAREVTSIAWSPEGKHIAACVYQRDEPPQLVLVSTMDGSVRVLAGLKREIYPTTISFSPDGRHVAYDRLPDEMSPERDIFLMSIQTGEEIPLIQHPADDYLLGWSRDGQWIVFASDRKGALGLWAIGISDLKTQGEPILIKPGIDRVRPVGLTRDGALYYGSVKATEDVFVVDLDPVNGNVTGPPKKAIERYEGGNFSPAYSPDGKYLAYVSRRGNSSYPTNVGNALCIRSLDSGEERVLYREFWRLGMQNIDGPGWSPDGRFIILRGWERRMPPAYYLAELKSGSITRVLRFGPDERGFGGAVGSDKEYYFVRRNSKEDITQILALDLESRTERELYRLPALERGGSIALSPDAQWLALVNFGWGAVRSLKIIPTSGGDAKEILSFGETKPGMPPLSLAWAPDGRHILYGAPDPADLPSWDLWRVPVNGGTPEKIGLQRRWGIWELSVRPDGRQLCFAGRGGPSTDSELWVLENFLPPASVSK
jgi:Tol biopolymer transport system component